MKGAIDSIETFGLVDGPGIRTVVFLSGCRLRCLYCHNPEMWIKGKENMTSDELLQKILRNKPYFRRNSGGVTFSGGEPLLQIDFLLDICKKLKKEGIHIALDTCGVGVGHYDEILSLVDLVLFDVKYTTREGYKQITGQEMDESLKFIEAMNRSGKPVWIRQVIVPSMMDSVAYIDSLVEYIKKIKNVERVEFLPFHHMGFEKYEKLNIPNPLKDIAPMDVEKCNQLHELFIEKWEATKKKKA